MVTSVVEAEKTGMFQNAKTALAMQNLLQHMGHFQPPNIIRNTNSTTTGFANNIIQMKQSKSWDMNLNCLRGKEYLRQFKILCDKGKHNGADYFTKHSSIKHHRITRPEYIRELINLIPNTKYKSNRLC